MSTTPTTTTTAGPAETPAAPNADSTAVVLVADAFESSGIQALEDDGCTVHSQPDLSADDLPKAIADVNPDVLIVRSTKVTEAAFDAAKKLSLVVRAGAGYDTIDVAAASARGIFVANCPGKNSVAVAELVWGLILSCDRRIPDQTAELRAGTWNKNQYSKARGLYGRVLGIVGLGQIGLEVARRGQAFGMKVYAWSRSLTEEKADALGIGYCSNVVNLAKMSDVISVNVAANDDTRHLIDEKFCSAMLPGAYLINTSRGSVVDEQALTTAIRKKGVRAGLDVYAEEPASGDTTFTDPIVNEPGVYGTHHIGASTDQSQQAIADEAVRVITTYTNTGVVPNCVNRAEFTAAIAILTVRHLNKPGVLAHVFYTLGQAGINVEEMENIIYEGEEAACARIQLTSVPSEEDLNTIGSNDNVLSVDIAEIRNRK